MLFDYERPQSFGTKCFLGARQPVEPVKTDSSAKLEYLALDTTFLETTNLLRNLEVKKKPPMKFIKIQKF